MAGAYLEIAKGETYTFTANVALDGTAVDLSAADLRFLAKLDPENDADADAIINASTSAGSIVVSGANSNTVTITLTNTVTKAFDLHPLLFWQLKTITASNAVYGLDQGRCAIVVGPVRAY